MRGPRGDRRGEAPAGAPRGRQADAGRARAPGSSASATSTRSSRALVSISAGHRARHDLHARRRSRRSPTSPTRHGLRVHLDGARLANAAAALGVPLRALTTDAGVDIVSFGATKNGALAAEAVVVLDPELAGEMLFLRKQTLQLASKMRFLAAQLGALLSGELWRENARARQRDGRPAGARRSSGTPVSRSRARSRPTPCSRGCRTRRGRRCTPRFDFYDWDEAAGEVRWMCAWDTTEADVDAFAAAVRAALTDEERKDLNAGDPVRRVRRPRGAGAHRGRRCRTPVPARSGSRYRRPG